MSIAVKICGLQDTENVRAAVEAGARYTGFVFHPSSKRFISTEKAAVLTALVPSSVKRIGLFVDPGDEDIGSVLARMPLDILQLHGKEMPERIKDIRAKFNLPVMKALRIASAEDLKSIADFEAAADMLMFDAKIDGEDGGTGKSFDWTLLRGLTLTKPWMLAGGLNAGNIAAAVRTTGAKILDVSSGVESAPGQKDPEKIREFIAAAAKLG